jgi:hypothetical protein
MMDELPDRLTVAADRLTDAAQALRAAGAGAHDFGGDSDGVPGLLGSALHQRWTAALRARTDEIAAASARLAETSAAVRAIRREYAETDHLVSRRLQRRA